MMKRQIRYAESLTNDMMYYLFWFCFFKPPFIYRLSNTMSRCLTLLGLFAFFALLVIKKRRFRFDTKTVFFCCIMLWCIFVTFVQTEQEVFPFLKDTLLPCIEVFLVFSGIMRSDGKRGLTCLYRSCVWFIIIDFLSLICFPHGIFRSSFGSSVERAQWVFGSKNNAALFLTIFVVLIAYYERKTLQKWRIFPASVLMSYFAIAMRGNDGLTFMGGSMTGLVALTVTVVLILFYVYKKACTKNYQFLILLVAGFAYLFILSGGTSPFLQKLIVNILHKNITYSGRTRIWENTMQYIMSSPIMGNGEQEFLSDVNIQGVWVKTSYTYNAVLKILLNYGMVGLAMIVLFIVSTCTDTSLHSSILFSGLIGLLVIGLMNEIELKYLFLFPFFILSAAEEKHKR